MDGDEYARSAGRDVASILKEIKTSADPPGLPLYAYFLLSDYNTAMMFFFRRGQNGLWMMIIEGFVVDVGTATFDDTAQWDDSGIQRSGWIYTLSGGRLEPSTLFVPDFEEQDGFEVYPTVLPYTAGQAPTIAGETTPFERWVTGSK